MDNDELLVVIKDMFESTIEKLEKRLEKKFDEKIDNLDQKINNLGVAFESLRSDVKAIVKGHSVLDAKIDRLDAKVGQMDKNLNRKIDDVKDELKTEIKIVQNYVIGVDERLNEHEVIFKRVK